MRESENCVALIPDGVFPGSQGEHRPEPGSQNGRCSGYPRLLCDLLRLVSSWMGLQSVGNHFWSCSLLGSVASAASTAVIHGWGHTLTESAVIQLQIK